MKGDVEEVILVNISSRRAPAGQMLVNSTLVIGAEKSMDAGCFRQVLDQESNIEQMIDMDAHIERHGLLVARPSLNPWTRTKSHQLGTPREDLSVYKGGLPWN